MKTIDIVRKTDMPNFYCENNKREKIEKLHLNLVDNKYEGVLDLSFFPNLIILEILGYDGRNVIGFESLSKLKVFECYVDGEVPQLSNIIRKLVSLEKLVLRNPCDITLDLRDHISFRKLVINEKHPKPIAIPENAKIFICSSEREEVILSELHTNLCEYIIPTGFKVQNRKYELGDYCRGGYWSQKFYVDDELVKKEMCISTYVSDTEIYDFLLGKRNYN